MSKCVGNFKKKLNHTILIYSCSKYVTHKKVIFYFLLTISTNSKCTTVLEFCLVHLLGFSTMGLGLWECKVNHRSKNMTNRVAIIKISLSNSIFFLLMI